MSSKLYVSNLDSRTTSADLVELFSGAGKVLSAKVITDRETQRSRGFAFVEMESAAAGLKAISTYNGQELNERRITVQPAQDNQPHRQNAAGTRGGAPKFREVRHKVRGGRKARHLYTRK